MTLEELVGRYLPVKSLAGTIVCVRKIKWAFDFENCAAFGISTMKNHNNILYFISYADAEKLPTDPNGLPVIDIEDSHLYELKDEVIVKKE